MSEFQGKVALITGGSRGVGRAITLELARRGADVVIAYLRKRDAAERTAHEASKHGGKVVAIRANVGDEARLAALFDEISDLFGRLDFFVSNAATGVIKPVEELDERAWRWTMDANARALLLGSRLASALMHEGGSIVALSSLGSTRVLPGYGVVGASKAAIESLIRYLAVELGPRGIRANTISPGVIDTEALDHFPMRDEMIRQATARSPVGRLTSPEDVAKLTAFLLSPDAYMINGHTVVIDGGESLLAS